MLIIGLAMLAFTVSIPLWLIWNVLCQIRDKFSEIIKLADREGE